MMGEDQTLPDADDIVQDDIADAGVENETPQAVEAQADVEAAPKWEAEDEQEARLFGWKSPDEWQGEKPAGYIDNPDEYLDRVKRSRIFSTMQEKLDQHERTAQDNARRLESMNQAALERQRQQFEAQMQGIVSQQRQAVMDADPDRFDDLERQRRDLLDAQPQAEPHGQPQPAQPDPAIQEYMATEKGAWVKNPVLKDLGAQLIGANPSVLAKPPMEQIKFAEAELRKMYPAYFPQEEQPKAKPVSRQTVDPGGLAAGAGKASGAFSKLPGDAKAQFKRFVQQGIFTDTKEDREEYANEYNAA